MTAEGAAPSSASRPRLGFLGVGWIGQDRMKAASESGVVEVAVIADPSAEMTAAAKQLAPNAMTAASLDEMLASDLDGIVIATPSAMHASQSMQALERGLAVFCQKPLGRSAREVEAVVAAARKADSLLGVDFSYRFTEGMRRIRELVRTGELGRIYAVDLVFHNAYGPDKGWFYDPELSGGGCVMDLGVHLVDLALWVMSGTRARDVSGALFAQGAPLTRLAKSVEDFGLATVVLEDGTAVRLACSWRVSVGADAEISATFYGTEGSAALRNVNGSFYDFRAERYTGTKTEVLVEPPDDWSGRAMTDWCNRLAAGERFSEDAQSLIEVAVVLDRIYGRPS